jgi:NADH:ubiquinone oxidoreductase subunit 5 (subunit L)/multisubunit Na+/H+ antiporter MnhA subunit
VALDFAAQAGNFAHMMLGYLIFALLIVGAGITAFYGLRMMGFVFREERYKSDRKITGKPPSLMRVSIAATLVVTMFIDFLALLLIWPFNRFFLPMFEQMTFNNIGEVLVYIIPSISTVLTCVAVAFGGYPAYKIYITRKADAGSLMEKYRFLKTVHKVLRNRFYIDAFYYKVASSARFFSHKIHNSLEYGLNALNGFTASRFLSLARITYTYAETEGITKPQIMGFRKFFDTAYRGMALLSQWAYPRLELGGFEAFNRLMAKAVTGFSRIFRKIQSGVLSYNILAVFAGIILLAILLCLFGGGF